MRAPAATAAARRTASARAPASRRAVKAPGASRAASARAATRPKPAARATRRAILPRPARTPAPRIHRRVSGPARGRTRARPAPRRTASPWALRTVRFVRALPDRPLVHRLVRGQGWIVLLGFLLMGIVAMQVSLLKLNAGIGRDVERAAALQRRNGELRAEVSRLSSGERIQGRAAELGMVMPPAGAVSYLRPRPGGDVPAAVGALRAGRFAPGAPAGPPPGLPPDTSGGVTATETGEAAAPESQGTDSTTNTTTTASPGETAPAATQTTPSADATGAPGQDGALEAAPAGSAPAAEATGGGTAG